MCTLYNYIKNIYFVHTFYLCIYQSITDYLYSTMYNYNRHKLYTFCDVCNVFAVHHKYIVEVLGKFIRRTEMNDHSFER